MNLNCRIFSFQLRCRSNTILLNYLRGNQFFHSLSHKVPSSLCQRCLQHSEHVSQFRALNAGRRVLLISNWCGFSHFQRIFSTNAKATVKKISDKAVRKKLKSNEMRRLFCLAKPEKWNVTGAILLLFCSSAITMSIPFALGKVIDLIYTTDRDKMNENLNKVTAVLFVIFVFGALCNFGRVYLMNISAQKITRNLREKVFGSIMKQEVGFFDKNKTGELVNRLSADTSLVSNCVTMNISDGLRSFIMVAAGVSMMFFMSTELALVSLAIVPPVTGMAIVYGRFIRHMTTRVQDALAESTQVAEERISNIRTVKAFSKESQEVGKYEERMQVVLDLAMKESLARGGFFGMAGLSGNAIVLVVLYYGGTMVSGNTMTVGDLSAFLLYAAYIGISLGGLTSFYSELNRGLGASTRLWQLMDRIPAIPTHGGIEPLWEPEGVLTFEDVIFAYPGRKDTPVLQGLTLTVPSSKVTAVVGPSGSGKSTLAALLLRLYDPESGKVKLDGVAVSEYDPSWLRAHIGFVSQEPVLFSGSVKENVIYGSMCEVDDEKLIKVLEEANALGFVRCLPQGFDTLVGERGVMLSGGQKQRLAIARALIKNPKILLLDEATSALDAESEHLVQEALERIMKGRTVLTIAHRLSTIKNADQIAVLEKGRIVEIGSYEKLMMIEDGAFKKLVKHQTFQEPSIVNNNRLKSQSQSNTALLQIL